MARNEFSAKTKREAWAICDARCEACGFILHGKPHHFDHANPDALGGRATLDNCRVLCVACHRAKTSKEDAPRIAKSRRIRNKEAGIKKPTKFRGWRKMNGDVVFAKRS